MNTREKIQSLLNDNSRQWTQSSIAREIGISRERVRQLLDKMQEELPIPERQHKEPLYNKYGDAMLDSVRARMPADYIAYACEIGSGNASSGLRIIIEQHAEFVWREWQKQHIAEQVAASNGDIQPDCRKAIESELPRLLAK